MDRADAHHRGVVLYAAFRHPGRCSEVNQIRGKLPGICPAALTQHMVRATCIAEVVDTVQDLRADGTYEPVFGIYEPGFGCFGFVVCCFWFGV